MNNFNIGIPQIGTNGIRNWLKPIGNFLSGLISPSIKNILKASKNNSDKLGEMAGIPSYEQAMEQKQQSIQDKTEENIETQIGTFENNGNNGYFPPENKLPNNSTSETPTEKPTEQQQTVSNNPSVQNAFEVAKELRNEQWQREDELRKHVEEREDNAYQRMVEDMNKAGINPNLVNIQPSASGGGISNSTGMDYNLYEQELNKNLELIMQEIENNFKGTQNEKDRFNELIGKVLQLAGLIAFKK